MTEQEKHDRQIAMFGTTVGNMMKIFEHETGNEEVDGVYPARERARYAQCILSDAQEAMSRGDNETARQYINKAKYFMDKVR